MPRARRHRTVGGPAENVRKVVSDLDHLPRWWPGVERRRVELATSQRTRGLSRLGSPLVRGATAKRLDEALEGVDAIVGR